MVGVEGVAAPVQVHAAVGWTRVAVEIEWWLLDVFYTELPTFSHMESEMEVGSQGRPQKWERAGNLGILM